MSKTWVPICRDGVLLEGSTYCSPHDQKRIDQWFYHPPKGNQVERYAKINKASGDLVALIAEICPPSDEKTAAIAQLQIVRMQANAAIACNEVDL